MAKGRAAPCHAPKQVGESILDNAEIRACFMHHVMHEVQKKPQNPSNAGFMRVCRLLLFLSLSAIFHFDASFCIKICIKNHSCDAL